MPYIVYFKNAGNANSWMVTESSKRKYRAQPIYNASKNFEKVHNILSLQSLRAVIDGCYF